MGAVRRVAALAQSGKELFVHDVADASGRAAVAGMLAIILPVVSVVEGQLFPGGDVTPGHYPDLPADEFGVAIRSATVVEITCRFPGRAAVNVRFLIEFKDEGIATLAAPGGLSFRYLLSDVLDDECAGANWQPGERAQPVDGRRS